jgi:hypothetical protein
MYDLLCGERDFLVRRTTTGKKSEMELEGEGD